MTERPRRTHKGAQRGGIFRTATGWRAFIRVDGILYSHRFPADTTVQQMQDWRARTRVEKRGRGPKGLKRGRLGDDVVRYLATVRGRRSYATTAWHLEAWRDQLGGPERDRATVTRLEVTEALALWEQQGLAASTLNKRKAALSQLYRTVDGPEARNPVQGLRRFREPDQEPRGVPYRMVRAILAKLSRQGHAGKGQERPPDSLARARLLVMAYTGLPPATMMRIQPEHVDLKKGTVWVPGRHKGGGTSGQLRPLTRQGLAAFKALAKAGAWGPFSTSTVRRAFVRAVAAVQEAHPTWRLDGLRPYDLRHSFATAVFRVTGDLDVTRGLLGHTDRRTTLRYAAGAVLEVERRAVKKVSKGF